MKAGKGKACLYGAGVMRVAGVLMAVWVTNAHGQDQASTESQAPANTTQPAKPHFYSLGGKPLDVTPSKHRPKPPGCHLSKFGTLPVEMIGLRATVPAKVNGKSTRFILDTGASSSMMSSANAAALGIVPTPMARDVKLVGIGGDVKAQQAFVYDLHIPGLPIDNAAFVVGGTDAGNALLGANLLDQDDLELDLAHGSVTLFQESRCDNAPLAYWANDSHVVDLEPSKDPYDRRTFLVVTVNGIPLHALLDSGAPSTLMSRSAAERAGIDLKKAEGRAGVATGIGAKSMKEWVVGIDSVSVGTETIQHTEMLVIDGNIAKGTDMLLGADFLLAHHVYIANIQYKAYFTYNGGRVFNNAVAAADSNASDGGMRPAVEGSPKSAADYFLRGEGHLSRDEIKDALADLDKAIALSPRHSDYFLARARAYEADKRPDLSLVNLDGALQISPNNIDALLMRARLRLNYNNRTGAAADVKTLSAMLPPGAMQARAVAAIDIQLGQPAAALPLLDGWIVSHDNDASLGQVLGERCLARGLDNQMLDDALKDCHDAIHRDGKKPEYLESLGMVEWRLGNYSESIKAYKQALDKAPDSVWSRYGLGLAEIRDGREDAGNADLNAARVLDPRIDESAAQFGLTAKVQ